MKAPSPRRPNTPGQISLRLALLAFVLLAAQPSHWISCCLAATSGAHTTPLSSHEHARQDAAPVVPGNAAHQREDEQAQAHPATELGAHGGEFVITPHCVHAAHHHHPPCCADCAVPSLSQRSERPHAEGGLLCSYTTPAIPLFRLDVLEGRFTRAGPASTPPASPFLGSSLLGRAPPVSA